MALPQTISGVSFATIHQAKVYRASNGNHYAPFLISGVLVMFKADNGDNTWAEVDSAGNPAETAINSLTAVMDGTEIHIVTADNNITTDYLYHVFDTATDAWTIVDEVIENNVDTDVATNGHSLGIAVRSDGSVVVICVGSSDTIMSVAYGRVDYIIRSTGGTWGARVAVDDGGSVTYYSPLAVLGEADKVHFLYSNGTNFMHKSLNSSNSLSSAEAVNDAAFGAFYGDVVYYDDGGDEIIFGIWRDTAGSDVEYMRITNDGTPGAAATASDTAVGVSTVDMNTTIGVYGNDVYIIYEDNTSNDLFLAKDKGAGFGTDVEIWDGITNNRVKGSVYTIDNGNVVFGFVVLNSTTVQYNEYVLVYTSNLGVIDDTTTLYAPTIDSTVGVNLGVIDGTTALYASTVVINQTVNLGAIASTTVSYNLDADAVVDVNLTFIDDSTALYAFTVTIAQSVNLGAVALTTTLYAPAIEAAADVNLDFISSDTTLFSFTVTFAQIVNLDIVPTSTTLFAPSVDAAIDISLAFVADSTAVYTPVVVSDQTVNLGSVGVTTVLYAPTIDSAVDVSLAIITASTILYAQTTETTVSVGLGVIASSTTMFVPSVTTQIDELLTSVATTTTLYAFVVNTGQTVDLGIIPSTTALYAATIDSTVDVHLGVIAASTTFYALTVTANTNINLSKIEGVTTLYAPAMDATVDINLGVINTDTSLYALGVAINLDFVPSQTTLYTTSVVTNADVSLDKITTTTTVYNGTIFADATVQLDKIVNASVVYALQIFDGLAIQEFVILHSFLNDLSTLDVQPYVSQFNVFEDVSWMQMQEPADELFAYIDHSALELLV